MLKNVKIEHRKILMLNFVTLLRFSKIWKYEERQRFRKG